VLEFGELNYSLLHVIFFKAKVLFHMFQMVMLKI